MQLAIPADGTRDEDTKQDNHIQVHWNLYPRNAQDFICVLKKKITTHETWEDEVKRRSLSV